ncbi:putative reverse transcriptase domain-containing protein [Tanacetum coccineum]
MGGMKPGQALHCRHSDRKINAGSKTSISRPANANNNNHNNNNNNQKGNGCYECGTQGHFRRNCPKLRNNDRGNQAGLIGWLQQRSGRSAWKKDFLSFFGSVSEKEVEGRVSEERDCGLTNSARLLKYFLKDLSGLPRLDKRSFKLICTWLCAM